MNTAGSGPVAVPADADVVAPGPPTWVCTRCGYVLRIPLPDVVRMQTRQPSLEGTGEISLRHLVREALRMRPQRIVVGEVRQQECLDLLIALNSGIPGMCTVHANSAHEAVTKMCTLPLLAGDKWGRRASARARNDGGHEARGRRRRRSES